MKRIPAVLLLAMLSFAVARPADGQIFRGPNATRDAERAGRKNQKKANKAAIKKERALQKANRKQQKAVRKSEKTPRHA